MNEDELYLRALNLSYFYLNFRPRTKKEILDYLNKKAVKFKFDQRIIKRTVKSLEEENLINDSKFVEWFVEIKSVRKPKSKFMIKQQLFKHGVPKDLIDEYFEDKTIDELALAKKALEPKWERFSKFDKRERFKKAASFLGRRGFSYDIIKKTIAELEEKD